MIDSNFRNPYQRLIINPLLKWKRINRFSPHLITLFATLTGIMIPFCLYLHRSIWGVALLGLSGFCDTLDGSLARAKNLSSPRGAVLDIVSDRLVELAILIGLYLYAPQERGLLVIGMLGGAFLCVTTFLVVGIFQENHSEKSFHYSPGIMERTEAFIFFSLMILLPPFFASLAILFIGLTSLTAFIRITQFIKH